MNKIHPIGDGLARSLVESLGNDCTTAAAVTRIMFASPTGGVDHESVRFFPIGPTRRVLADFVRRGWLVPVDSGWVRGSTVLPTGVPHFLDGAASMRNYSSNDSVASAVVTMPAGESALGRALPLTGVNYSSLISTDDAFKTIANSAVASFSIMSPFLNEDGLALVIDLFGVTKARKKTLIVRRAGGAISWARSRLDHLRELDVKVLDYTLQSNPGYETFHAKILLADTDLAYVGSSNMTVFSRNSVELGVLMSGRAAQIVSSVVRAVEHIANPVS
jgi:hypothetical protein